MFGGGLCGGLVNCAARAGFAAGGFVVAGGVPAFSVAVFCRAVQVLSELLAICDHRFFAPAVLARFVAYHPPGGEVSSFVRGRRGLAAKGIDNFARNSTQPVNVGMPC